MLIQTVVLALMNVTLDGGVLHLQLECPALPALSCPQPVCPVPVCPAPVVTAPACPTVDAGVPVIDAGVPKPDAGAVADAGSPPPPPPPPPSGALQPLKVDGTKLVRADGSPIALKGVNLFTTRSCNACAYSAQNMAEWKRRADEALSWGANFIRLAIEDNASADGRVSWDRVSRDPAYLASIVENVRYLQEKGAYVVVALWDSATHDAATWVPGNEACDVEWPTLVRALGGFTNVVWGIANEPHASTDDAVKTQMERCRAAIRETEQVNGYPGRVIAIQMPRQWARYMGSWNATTWAHDPNVVLETHWYSDFLDTATNQNGQATTWWQFQIGQWLGKVPLYVGEFGPVAGAAGDAEMVRLAERLNAAGVPWTAWAFHHRCPPNLLVDSGGCGVGAALTPTSWGNTVKGLLK